MIQLPKFTLGLILLLCLPYAVAQTVIRDANITFTTIDVPGAGFTGVTGINKAGDMVGTYGKHTNGDVHGFLYRAGQFTFFDYPGQSETVPEDINDSGLIVGYAGDLRVRGFLYDGTTFTTIRAGNRSATFTLGINNAGDIVGGAGTVYSTRGFEIHGQKIKSIVPPPGGASTFMQLTSTTLEIS